MILNNIKTRRKDSGFTIVELLVVIVVIGILAAITIVAYTGVTDKANVSKALANGESVGKVIDMLAGENGVYPASSAAVITGGTYAKLPSGLVVQSTAPTSTNPGLVFQFAYCDGTSTTTTGSRLIYWDSQTKAVSTSATSLYFGTAKDGSSCTNA